MALVTLKELLDDAAERGYAVGSFNMVGFGFLNGILEAAETEKSPVILSIAQVHLPHMDVEQFVPAAINSAERADVPVAIHLDHGYTFDTVIKTIRWGFSSVMYDGSELPYEENLNTTKLVCRIARAAGISVEAELGKLGSAEASGETGVIRLKDLTDPDLAGEFVSETGVDALAISVGNAHGFYKTPPKIDFERIKKIKEKVKAALVLHGGTGIPDQDIVTAIKLGIRKINFFTGMTYAAVQRIREFILTEPRGYEWISLEAKNAIREVVRGKMRIFGSSGRG